MWERACSRMRCASQRICWLNHRIREQARSHNGSVLVSRSHTQAHAPTACIRLDRKSFGDTSNCFLNDRLKCAESVKPHL
ncbi:MAG TPA: hypothetical protein DIW86_02760 [Pseudomonas sp.]|nr:hypothetical protein [Pseudomonas sp.]